MAESLTWISASEARELANRLSRSLQDAAPKLIRLAADGALRTRCLQWSFRQGSTRLGEANHDLPAEFWVAIEESPDITDWDDGDFQSSTYDAIFGSAIDRAHEVAFCREDIEGRFSGRGAGASTPPHTRSPPYRAKQRPQPEARSATVSLAELREWFPDYAKTAADFVVEHVRQAAEADFGRRATRQPVRDLLLEFGKMEARGKRSVR
jgi:hypothetical protein